MKLKVNRYWKKPTRESVGARSFFDYLDKVGAKSKWVLGGVGRYGEKIHIQVIYYVETPDGIAILDSDSLCGSGTHWSAQIPYLETDLSKVNCKRCLKYLKKK